MFAVVTPKEDCPHYLNLDSQEILNFIKQNNATSASCNTCIESDVSVRENWLCLNCKGIFCSRYVNGHMESHYFDKKDSDDNHCVAFSFSDASFWCYDCDSYVYSPSLKTIALEFGLWKHCPDITSVDEYINNKSNFNSNEIINPDTKLSGEDIIKTCEELTDKFDKTKLIKNIKEKIYKKVCFLTGAGISVAAGIPDFRTPGIGLYSKINNLGLPIPTPEAIFSIDLLVSNPQLFYKIAKELFLGDPKPVNAHYFIKYFNDNNILLMNYTQNIDSLELDAGIDPNLLVQAHGHMKSAHCISCHKEYQMEEFMGYIEREEVFYCLDCNNEEGLVKPDIVFFGEKLPQRFAIHYNDIVNADLVFIMGTSLKVYPFKSLITLIRKDVPIVLINRDNTGDFDDFDNFLFLQGDIEEHVQDIMNQLSE